MQLSPNPELESSPIIMMFLTMIFPPTGTSVINLDKLITPRDAPLMIIVTAWASGPLGAALPGPAPGAGVARTADSESDAPARRSGRAPRP